MTDADTQEVLGASPCAQPFEELINIIKTVTVHHLTCPPLREQIFTHPTIAESFNDLFNL